MKNLLWQVCTPEQAEKLKKLGVTQNQSCYYFQHGQLQYVPQHFKVEAPDAFAAYTSTELGIMLPYYYQTTRIASGNILLNTRFPMWYCKNGWSEEAQKQTGDVFGGTEAMVRAGMLIGLLSRKLIHVQDVNSRLEAEVLV
jgi:hypothetical protein